VRLSRESATRTRLTRQLPCLATQPEICVRSRSCN
jgi:hypothetical protein